MIRREHLSLPFADQVPALLPLLEVGPEMPAVRPATGAARLVDAALAHGLGLALAGAVGIGRAELPSAERRRLARACAMRGARSLALREELGAIAKLVSEACGGSAPICVKGPAVADRLYRDPGDRSFGDLDLVVPRDSLRESARAMAAAGWIEDVEFAPDFAASFGHELHLRRRRGGIWLHCELHWRIGDDPLCEALDYRLMADGAAPLPSRASVLAPAPPVDLLLLCVHFVGDRERRLIWLSDIRRAADAATTAEWAASFELAERLRLGWSLHRALDYSERYAGLARERAGHAPGAPPPFGPLRAVEELDLRASLHIGRLAVLRGRERLSYLRTILVPTAEGLDGTTGVDGAPRWRAALRHVRSAFDGLRPGG